MAAASGMNALVPTFLGAVVAPAVLGAGVVFACGLSPRQGWRVFAAWAYLVGHFAQAWSTAGWLAAGQPVPGWALPLVGAAAGVLCWRWAVVRGRSRGEASRRRDVPGDPWLRLTVVVLAVVLFERCAAQSLQPIVTSDEANIWSAKAWVLFAGGDLGGWFAANYVQHADYPMLDPLAQVLAFASSGRALWWENRLPLQGFGFALLLLLSAALERRLPRGLAIAVLVAFTSTTFVHFAPTVYADVLLAGALLAMVDAVARWRDGGSPVWWRLACFAMAALLATKNEGAMLAVAALLAALVVRIGTGVSSWPKPGAAWAWLLVPLATVAAGQGFNAAHGLSNDLTVAADGSGLFTRILAHGGERIGPVLAHYVDLIVDGAVSGWLVLAMLLAPLAVRRGAPRADWWWPWLVVATALVGYVLVFLGTTADAGGADGAARGLRWHLATAADRTLLHLLPTAALALATCLASARPRN